MHGPTSHSYFSQRLRLHYVDWGNPDAPPMLLIHGGRDHCRNWDWVAEQFRHDYHIVAKMSEERINQPISKRLHNWMNDLRKSSGRLPRRYQTLEEAFQRMQTENPHLSEAQARHLTIHGSNQNEDGTFSWKFDNYVRSVPPTGVPIEETFAMYGDITCPTMLVRGLESWASDPVEDGRVQHFNCPLTIEPFEKAGHWVHHDQLEGFVGKVKQFLA